jgi:hypothetical protein
MDRIIDVTFVSTKVNANPNPLPDSGYVMPGETVTWRFDPKRELQVLFLKVRDLPDGSPLPCNPLGPFSSLTLGTGFIVGTIHLGAPALPPQRFLYNLFEYGTALPWYNPVPGEEADYGGIDIPMTPMASAS